MMDTRAGVPRVYGVTFDYDNRNRLIEEQRGAVNHAYYFRYTYDQAGNRKDKTDVLTGVVTKYTYDVSDPFTYGSQGNRLMYSVTYQGSPSNVLKERWYTYNALGHVDHVIRRIVGDQDAFGNQWYRSTRLFYTESGRLWIARSERWQVDPELPGQAVACEALAAMEYRYDSGRQRYLVRPRDPVTLLPYSASDGQWSDYDGDSIYGDYTISVPPAGGAPNMTDTFAHEAGLAQFDHTISELHHLHGNLIGTTECMTDDAGAIAHRAVYTAFGEPIHADGPVSTRYGYAGAWGYQMASPLDPLAELGWLHVGERYYDPSVGRFMQRDAMGILGGLNTYAYVGNLPTMGVDPDGRMPEWLAHTILTLTGGSTPVGNFIDKVGGQIERDRSTARLVYRMYGPHAGLARTSKGMVLPGQTTHTLIGTKLTGSLWWGRKIAAGSGYLTIFEGTIAVGDIGRGCLAWWYDVELDPLDHPLY